MVTEGMSFPGLSGTVTHPSGNGLIQFTQKEFCMGNNGPCNSLTVCQVGEVGEPRYYLPVRSASPLNRSKEMIDHYQKINC